MKKVLLFLFALLTTATVWAVDFTPLQMGENNGIELGSNDSDKGYLSFTPEETGYYVISTTCAESHSMALNLWSDSLYYAWSEPDALYRRTSATVAIRTSFTPAPPISCGCHLIMMN